jgi:hypothetical protein
MDHVSRREAAKPARLLRWTRSIWHPWLLWIAAGAGAAMALMVPLAALLAAAEPGAHSSRDLWTIAVIAVAVLAVFFLLVCAGCGTATILTRPVPKAHDETLKETAKRLAQTLDMSSVHGVEGYRPGQAFQAHFERLSARLDAWKSVQERAANAQAALDRHVDAAMDEYDLPHGDYNRPTIHSWACDLALRRAAGEVSEAPCFDWWRNYVTTAVEPDEAPIQGPTEGALRPFDGADYWVYLTPNDGENRREWMDRARERTQRVDAFVGAVYESTLREAKAVLRTQARVKSFRQDELPAIRDTLDLIQEREPPRSRPFRCPTC